MLQREYVKICDRNNIQIVEDYFSHKFSRNLSEVYCSQKYQRQSFADVLKKVVFKNFAKFSGKHLCWSFILIKKDFMSNFIKKRNQHMCFPVNFAKFLRTTFLMEHLH